LARISLNEVKDFDPSFANIKALSTEEHPIDEIVKSIETRIVEKKPLEHEKGKKVGTLDWYKSQAEIIEEVHDVVLFNRPVGNYTVGIVVNSKSKPIPDNLINIVRDWFYLDENLIGGMDVIVKKADEKPTSFQITGAVAKGQNPDVVKGIINNDLMCLIEGGATSTGINYFGLNIGETLYLTQIYDVLMAIKHILPTWYITALSVDITPRSDQVLVFGEAKIQL